MSTRALLLERWTGRGYPPSIGEALLEKYAEDHRRYHTAEHLWLAFEILDGDPRAVEEAAAISPVDREALELAVWYHDREYEPRHRENEERSAVQFLGDAAALPVSTEVRARVGQMILISRHHDPPACDVAAALFCDLDLAILGESKAAYAAYQAAVRQEYEHVPDGTWRWARRRVLNALVARPRIYHYLLEREGPARRNLLDEIVELGPAYCPDLLCPLLDPTGLRTAAALLFFMLFFGAALVVQPKLLTPLLLLLALPGVSLFAHRGRRQRLEATIREGTVLFADEPRRRRLWQALSDLYLDTEVDLGAVARAVAETGYADAEIRAALRNEVGPILAGNLGWMIVVSVGEWLAFDQEWLRTEILLREAVRPSPVNRRGAAFLCTWFVERDLQAVLRQLHG